MSALKAKIKANWEYIQGLLDVNGDVIMLAFSLAIIARLVLVVKGYSPLTAAEAATYGSAVAAFAYSNKGPGQS